MGKKKTKVIVRRVKKTSLPKEKVFVNDKVLILNPKYFQTVE